MPTSDEYRRQNDKYMAQCADLLTEQGRKLDDMKQDFHQMEIHIAELKAIQHGRVEQAEYRITTLEAWRDSTNKYLIGLVLAVVTAILLGGVSLFFQNVVNSGAGHK